MATIVIRRSEAMRRVGLKASAFDELRHRHPDFPRPVYLTTRTPCWVEAELEAWLQAHIAERDGRAA